MSLLPVHGHLDTIDDGGTTMEASEETSRQTD
jgi:hypothetical protein